MTVVTTLSPITPGEVGALANTLWEVQSRQPHPMSALTSTHFARFVLVDSLGRGPVDLGRHVLPRSYLLFSAAFDRGTSPHAGRDAYFSELCGPAFRGTADSIWVHCEDYPGTTQPDAFRNYLRACSLPTRLEIAGYEETLPQVRSALGDHRAVTELALRTQDLEGDAMADAVAALLLRLPPPVLDGP